MGVVGRSAVKNIRSSSILFTRLRFSARMILNHYPNRHYNSHSLLSRRPFQNALAIITNVNRQIALHARISHQERQSQRGGWKPPWKARDGSYNAKTTVHLGTMRRAAGVRTRPPMMTRMNSELRSLLAYSHFCR